MLHRHGDGSFDGMSCLGGLGKQAASVGAGLARVMDCVCLRGRIRGPADARGLLGENGQPRSVDMLHRHGDGSFDGMSCLGAVSGFAGCVGWCGPGANKGLRVPVRE
jgi:hypothetical protein